MFANLIERMVFQPDPDVGPPPPGAEERWIDTADGVRLHAWYVRGARDGPKGVSAGRPERRSHRPTASIRTICGGLVA